MTLDGLPLANGNISFIPINQQGGSTVSTAIEDGHFAAPRKQGAVAGKFRVEIIASRKTGRTQRDDITGQPVPVVEQYIPRCYNSQSELIVEVHNDQTNEFTFSLNSQQKDFRQ